MKDFKPLDLILSAIDSLKSATKRQIIKHHKITEPSQKESIQQSLYNARQAGLITGKRETGNPETSYSLTQLGKDKLAGKELKLNKKTEVVQPADIAKAVASAVKPLAALLPAPPPQPRKDEFGATFNSDGKLIIWHGHDEVVFNPPEAANIIAFIANQMPWVEYCKQHGGSIK